jgi:hypothetical protein
MLRAAAGRDWTLLEVRATSAGGMTKTGLSIHLADESVERMGGLDRDGRLDCHELREVMHQEGKGSWYNATFTVDDQKQLEAEFDYDNPPFLGIADDQLLTDDQRDHPRSLENLPLWHPCPGGLTAVRPVGRGLGPGRRRRVPRDVVGCAGRAWRGLRGAGLS